jgi:RNA polymerase sigma-70 factor (ECF subfamily)
VETIKKLVSDFAENNNQKSFSDFFNHYYPKLLRFSYYILGSELMAEEAVSDVFVKVWKNRSRIIEVDNLDFYLFTAVRNQSLSYLKKRGIDFTGISDSGAFSFIDRVNPESELLDRELLDKVNDAIHSLPAQCQLIFKLSRDEGFKYAEVAQILGISKSTVKNQMTLALKKIRASLADYFNHPDEPKYPFLMSLLF